MLGHCPSLLFRLQNEPQSAAIPIINNSKFLPANYYPVQTPRYTVQWTKHTVEIVERIRETAKIVHQLDLAELKDFAIEEIFNPTPKNCRPNKRTKGSGFLFGNWTSWMFKKPKKDNHPRLEIVNVVPLMYDETLFDSLVALKKSETAEVNSQIGFVRMRLLMTGNLKNIQSFNDFIPSLPIKSSENSSFTFASWKHFIFGFDGEELKFINLNCEDESEWKSLNISIGGVEEIRVCEDKLDESRIVMLLRCTDSVFKIVTFDGSYAHLLNTNIHIEHSSASSVCGYVENDNLYVIQGQNLYEISLANEEMCVFLLHDNFQFKDSQLYLFPWRQDLKVSALLFYLSKRDPESFMYKISIMTVIGTISEIILESDWFKSEKEIISMFATSSLELFLLDAGGNVLIYSGLMINTDWQWNDKQLDTVVFEFTHWFNILGEFPFKPSEYYNSRRLQVNDTLFIDDLLRVGCGVEFPPTNWKSLGHACRQLKDENIHVILYYLLAAGTNSSKLQSFYNQFGLTERQVSAIELAFACDHGDYSRASKVYCTRKIEEEVRIKFTGKIVKFMKTSEDSFTIEELTKFSLFAAGRIISIDLLLEDEPIMTWMLESILKSRDIPTALEWIKG